MTDAKKPRQRRVDRGGLPADEDLSAFAVAARDALGPPGAAEGRPALAAVRSADHATVQSPAVPAPAPNAGSGTIARTVPVTPEPPGQGRELAAELDDTELPEVSVQDLIRQATFKVDVDINRRFRAYQKREGRKGPEPGNGDVIWQALTACEGRYGEVVAARKPQAAAGRRFGAPVPGRRIASEAVVGRQINFRPTHGEIADIKRLQKRSGASSVTAFLNAVLDDFLPR